MKIKITSFHLITVVIVQIILIDAVLAVFFLKQSGIKKSYLISVKTVSEDGGNMLYTGVYRKRDALRELIEKNKLRSSELKVFKIPDRPGSKMEFIATAYDLSYKSCGKYPSHPAYGITFSGKKAARGRTIAVDPEVITLGSVVYIEFPGRYSYLDGLYTAEDTGSKIKGNMLDVFLGESAFREIENFGSMMVYVNVIFSGEKDKAPVRY